MPHHSDGQHPRRHRSSKGHQTSNARYKGAGHWDQTEGDEQYEYGYLEGRWEKGTHRKWCAILEREQFDEFVEHCGLTAESTETMGSIGAPGFGFGWAPAISFNGDHEDCIAIANANAYVTPIPEVERESFDEQDWERVRGAVLSVYG